jgi:1,4-dihydroxy-6-naphthoate synthase
MTVRSIRAAVSPDADDLFMVRALLLGLVPADPPWVIETHGTDALNRLASTKDAPDVCAVSAAHWPAIADRFDLMWAGGSFGDGYGPVVVAPRRCDLAGARIAIPGETTTAALVLRLAVPDAATRVVPIVPYDRVFDAVRNGDVDAAVLIHEGRLTFADRGLVEILDLGVWWADRTRLPLPLGLTAVRRDADGDALAATLTASIEHALAHRDEAIAWLLERGTPLATPARVDAYLELYANRRALGAGDDAAEGLERLLAAGRDAGLLAKTPPVRWVGRR